jgi:hypothetical protein
MIHRKACYRRRQRLAQLQKPIGGP